MGVYDSIMIYPYRVYSNYADKINFMPKNNDVNIKIINRISRLEGQIKGIRRMFEDNKDCLDIITQINAVRVATSMLGVEILKNDLMCKKENREKISDKYIKTLFKTK